jgi:hypothetical protein
MSSSYIHYVGAPPTHGGEKKEVCGCKNPIVWIHHHHHHHHHKIDIEFTAVTSLDLLLCRNVRPLSHIHNIWRYRERERERERGFERGFQMLW